MKADQTAPERLWQGGPLLYQAGELRLTTDAVLLGDFVRVKKNARGADLGCASGVLMLLTLWREPGLHMTGLELSAEAVRLAETNMSVNGFADRAELICGDLRETARKLESGSFDFVLSNPPYFTPGSGAVSPESGRASARAELSCCLEDICAAASHLCRSGGSVFFCYRPDGMNRLLSSMASARLEPKRLRFVHHRPGKEAGLLLAEGRKNGRPGLKVEPPLILFTEDGLETEEYCRIYHRQSHSAAPIRGHED